MATKINKIEEIFGFDLRSLALFRISLALVIIADLLIRMGEITSHYTDVGILPRAALAEGINKSWYWSINLISGQSFIQWLIFLLALFIALLLLVGYRTRLATIAAWAMVISIHNRNPVLIFAADDVLRAVLFWSMFLPLGACYSIDSALNISTKPLPKRIVSGATVAFIIQICYIYIWSAAFKTKSEIWWPQGEAVYYALHFDQYAAAFGGLLTKLPMGIQKILTLSTLIFEWVGPLMVFIPFRTSFFRCVAIISFILLHIGFGLSFQIGIFPFLSISHWLAFIPSNVWDRLAKRLNTPKSTGLKINYDADCGFCKKIVLLLRTFLILPGTPIVKAQDNPSIYADMQERNSWVVEDEKKNRYYQWEGMVYLVSLSPILFWLAPIMRLKPLMGIGNKIYKTIASNRSVAGKFTAPLKYRAIEVNHSWILTIIAFSLLGLATIFNFKTYVDQSYYRSGEPKEGWISSTHKFFTKRTFQKLGIIANLTRLDQSWSIFAPAPPRDDGWHVIEGKLKDGTTVNLLKPGSAVSWEKLTRQQRDAIYRNMQWRTYFINLNRAIGTKLYPYYGNYLCKQWNDQHSGDKQLDSLDIYFMSERTVPPGEIQTVEKNLDWEQSCSNFEKK